MRLLIAEDSALLREGLVRLMIESGHDVVATAADATQLDQLLTDDVSPDVALLDIRMPPTYTDEGSQAALALRSRYPSIGILMLSQHIEAGHAVQLLTRHPRGFGYLLKDKVIQIDDLLAALEQIARGGHVIDPDVVTELLGRAATREALTRLTPRERDVLALIAEGCSNAAVGRRLHLSAKTVENHVSSIFSKLDLNEHPDDHRRVHAVLMFLAGRNESH